MNNQKALMLRGDLYFSNHPPLVKERERAKKLCARFNRATVKTRETILAKLLGRATDAYFEPPFFCDYGYNLRLGRKFYANHNLVVLDCAPVTIGDNVFMGPNVMLAAAGHPLDAKTRNAGLEFAKPITIGDDVWLGGNVVVLPGVTIGSNVVIGAGAVVTRDIPSNCVAVGNPCRPMRRLKPSKRFMG